jgi:hypothetical protein
MSQINPFTLGIATFKTYHIYFHEEVRKQKKNELIDVAKTPLKLNNRKRQISNDQKSTIL